MLDNKIGYDLTFELNEFNQPKLKSEVEMVKDIVLFVLFSKPGQYPSLPGIGLDIQSMLYSFYDEIDEGELKSKIIEQCNALGTYFKNGMINIKKTIYKKQPSLMIHIEGTESFPDGYMKDHNRVTNKYLIGLTFDDMEKMIYNINTGGI